MSIARLLVLFVCLFPLDASADVDRAQAREHYLKGTRAFELGAFEEAIVEYGAAYRIKDDPALLYNLGQANRLAGHSLEALHLYKVYLTRKPDAPNRVEVEAKIAELQKLIDQQTKTKNNMPPDQVTPPTPAENEAKPGEQPAPPVTPPVETSPTAQAPSPVDLHAGRVKKIAGLAVGAVGIAALATGIAFGVLAKNAGDDLTRLDQQMGTFDASTQRAGQTDQIVEGVMLGIGGAAVVAGVVVYMLGHREARAARLKAATLVVPMVGTRQAGAALHLSF